MKRYINNYFTGVCLSVGLFTLVSCNDFLDREPLDSVTPQAYLNNENDLAAYAVNAYNFSTHSGWGLGTLTGDNHTDNMCTTDPSYNLWVPKYRRVPNKSDDYSFSRIRNCNYFFEQVKPKLEAKSIIGNEENINHYVGEMYFMRAWEYFQKLRIYGDFPIVTSTLTDDKEALIAASQRRPRNEVARFIISNLDSAIVLLKPEFKNKNRLTRNAAYLLKSRVALYEASWETYHKNTPFVPGGPDWPGAKATYNQGFSVNLDAEIAYFLDQAMSASKEVADHAALTPNTHVMNPESASPDGWNSYFDMFSTVNMGGIPEILFWRAYDKGLNITHGVSVYVRNGGNNGLTKGYVDSYLMKSGLPIYADRDYKGDKTIDDQKAGRDERLQLFMFGNSDRLTMESDTSIYKTPGILGLVEVRDVTGYRIRKCYNYDPSQAPSSGMDCYYGSIIFRAAEAYLNYMEACYMKNNSLDATAQGYWKALRERAGVDSDYSKTIAATDLSRENDWAKYSAGNLIDATLYSIRRERRSELIGESMRMDDLKRWRALDQVKDYIPEGFNLWDEAYKEDAYYEDRDGQKVSLLIEPGTDRSPNVSSRRDSKYLLPYRIIENNNQVYNGYTWSKANYLTPLPAYEILLTANAAAEGSDIDLGSSPLYQNPYWPLVANESATE